MEKWSVINHYRNLLSTEENYIQKFGRVKIAIVYPNSYEIAMQNIGYQEVYRIFNSFDNVSCERFVLDFFENNLSIENQRFLREFDIIALSINYEEDVLNFIKFLNNESIPIFNNERDEQYPLIIAGGALTFINPAMLIDIVDVELLGDIVVMSDELESIFSNYVDKNEAIKRLKNLPYALTKDKYPAKVVLRNKSDVIASTIKTSMGEFAGEYLVELSSGCKYSCRFCTATFAYRPFRVFDFEKVKEKVVGESFSKNLGLISAAFGDLPDVKDKLRFFVEKGFYVSVSSLRADTLDRELIDILKKGGVKSITIAEETCADRLKKLINKMVSKENILNVASMVADCGIENLKLYYMIGLPSENYDEALMIADRVREIAKIFFDIQKKKYRRLGKIKVSINIFIPKPFTPLQYFGLQEKKLIERKIKGLRKELGRIPNVKYDIMNYKSALLQAFLARGEDYLNDFYKKFLENGFNIQKALKFVDAESMATKCFDENYVFLWEKFVEPNFDKNILKNEFRKCLEILKG
ncbi:radical SAM protein [Deferribacter autotrophicus]|uniref:Radical SAM protein n=1 Tax=Deferribacter autotrophicus TaxID=500465 RepID=A0A5A8F8S6_9BACT|nr:radical SAM protein [Deferribacter autotrophicus]KAA0259186.1 radical SAM protein [Deferribacter autotrophicus]